MRASNERCHVPGHARSCLRCSLGCCFGVVRARADRSGARPERISALYAWQRRFPSSGVLSNFTLRADDQAVSWLRASRTSTVSSHAGWTSSGTSISSWRTSRSRAGSAAPITPQPADPFVGRNCVALAKGQGENNLNKFKFLENVNLAGCGVY